jgi:hypothetical protein
LRTPGRASHGQDEGRRPAHVKRQFGRNRNRDNTEMCFRRGEGLFARAIAFGSDTWIVPLCCAPCPGAEWLARIDRPQALCAGEHKTVHRPHRDVPVKPLARSSGTRLAEKYP